MGASAQTIIGGQMLSLEQHIDNLARHIDLVRSACLLLGKKLIQQGRPEFGRLLIARGFAHDNTKFYGIEFDYLHAGKDVPKTQTAMAMKHHCLTNSHHPEFSGGIANMCELDIAEMVTDWYARAQEFGTDLRDWIQETAIGKYKIDVNGLTYSRIIGFVDLLLENSFVDDLETSACEEDNTHSVKC